MNVVGKTQCGKLVVSGLGKLYFENGLPLSVLFDGLQRRDLVPSFRHLVTELEQNGMKRERIIHLLNEQIFESYGKEFRDEVIKRL
jgi:hypothetical protein